MSCRRLLLLVVALVLALAFTLALTGGRLFESPAEEIAVDAGYAPTFPEPIPFDSREWDTNDLPRGIADARATKGGALRLATPQLPPTLRTEGPNSRLAFLSDLHGMVYEALLGFSLELQDYVPGLATHWQVSPDRKTFRFRIDARARWADGRDVTADDVRATIAHLKNPDRQDPLVSQYWEDLIEGVRVLDRWTVEVRTREARWRALLAVGAGMLIYPAAYIRMDGETYLRDWNWKLPPGSGPYEIRAEDVDRGRSITLRRRRDYWARDLPENQFVYNFDDIVWHVVPDVRRRYRMFFEGHLDAYEIPTAGDWTQWVPAEHVVRRGWVQRRRIQHAVPPGYGGICLNLRSPPLDSRGVREALACLFDCPGRNEKLCAGHYECIDSYFPGQRWAREDAQPVAYAPARARELLAGEGWTRRESDGRLVDAEGRPFPPLRLLIDREAFNRLYAGFAVSLWEEAGIRLSAEDPGGGSPQERVWNRDYQMVPWNWTAGSFPEPAHQFHSRHALEKQTNNLNGFANEEADALMEAYQLEWDADRRRELLQQLDQILFGEHLYLLGWYAPFWRVAFWDRFGHPPEYMARHTRGWISVMAYWWFDEARSGALDAAIAADLPLHTEHAGNQYDAVEQTWWRENLVPKPEPELEQQLER